MPKYEPTSDLILIEPLGAVPYAKGGLVLPKDAAIPMPHQARVLKCGPGTFFSDGTRVPMPCKDGDFILFHHAGGVQLDRAGAIVVSASAVLVVCPDGFDDEDDEAPSSESTPHLIA